jgi:AraC-like DNA-binding protein
MCEYSAYIAQPALNRLIRLHFTSQLNEHEFLSLLHPIQPFSIKDMTPVIDYIFRQNGVIRVKHLTDKFHISRRWLEKQFAEQVGISPKEFARMTRFNALLTRVETTPSVSWTELIDNFGYYDQSHLNRDFHEFTGLSPTQYFKNSPSDLNTSFNESLEST